jgi:hypothetical protein
VDCLVSLQNDSFPGVGSIGKYRQSRLIRRRCWNGKQTNYVEVDKGKGKLRSFELTVCNEASRRRNNLGQVRRGIELIQKTLFTAVAAGNTTIIILIVLLKLLPLCCAIVHMCLTYSSHGIRNTFVLEFCHLEWKQIGGVQMCCSRMKRWHLLATQTAGRGEEVRGRRRSFHCVHLFGLGD